MAFIPNQQEANSPQASSVTTSQTVAVAPSDVGPPFVLSTQLLFSSTPGLSPSVSDGYYLIIQNSGTINLEIAFNGSTNGITLYAGTTFECAVAQGANLWVINANIAVGGELRVIAFA